MSDYYEFSCPKCLETGGFFSRQSWGWGNCDIVETFRFITCHVSQCGARSFDIVWEQDEKFYRSMKGTKHITDWTAFPHSVDWNLQSELVEESGASLHDAWTEILIREGYVKRAEDHNERVTEEMKEA